MKQASVRVVAVLLLVAIVGGGVFVPGRPAHAQEGGDLFLPAVLRVDAPTNVIAFSRNGNILLLDPERASPSPAFSGVMGDIIFRWTTSGQLHRFARIENEHSTLMTSGPGGANLQVLATIGPGIYDIAWSPDGKQVAYVRMDGDNSEIYIMQPDGSDTRSLVGGPGYHGDLHWSPDSNKIAFGYAPLGTWPPALYVMGADGRNQIKISEDIPSPFSLRWSPDGSRIAFVSGASSATTNDEIVAINVDGTGLTDLTNHANTDSDPAWSPDGDQIAFVSYRNDAWYLYIMQADGSNQRPLSPEPGFYQHLRWSPDATMLAFIKDYPRTQAVGPGIIVPPDPIYDLGVIDLKTGIERRLTYGLEPFGFVWSVPDR